MTKGNVLELIKDINGNRVIQSIIQNIKNDLIKGNLNKLLTNATEKKEDLFPFRIVGDAKKKSNHLGKYNNRYLELDSIKSLIKRRA